MRITDMPAQARNGPFPAALRRSFAALGLAAAPNGRGELVIDVEHPDLTYAEVVHARRGFARTVARGLREALALINAEARHG